MNEKKFFFIVNKMETEIKNSKSEFTQVTNSIFSFRNNKNKNSTKIICKNEINNLKKDCINKKKINRYRNIKNNNSNKTLGTQTYSYTSKSTDKKIIFKDIKNICENIYNNSRNKEDNYRIKLKEDIIKSIDNYVFTDLRKNILFPKMFNVKTKKIIKIPKVHFFSKKKKEKKEKKEGKESIDSNKVTLKEIWNDYSENSCRLNRGVHKNVKVYKCKYGDYAKNDVKFNHPQIYTLNNTYRNKTNLPIIIPHQTLNSLLDFTKLIPEKKSKEIDFNKKLYKAYQTMKSKSKKEIGIYI